VSLRQLKWLTVVAPILFLAVVDYLRRSVEPELMQSWVGDLLVGGVVLFAVLLFSESIFGRIEQMQSTLERQNRELLALHDAGLDVAGRLELDDVLQKVVDNARELIGARYGALSVPSPGGSIEAFITSGLSREERELIGPLPVGHGLLSVVLEQRQPLRLADLTRDPRSVGVPANHPRMRSLLAVPIASGARVLGNLYLTEKQHAPEFSREDEQTLTRFATQAALAIDNARLHRGVRELAIAEERDRIGREMHDSLAQVLGYVITKAQAVQEYLRRDQTDRAVAQLGQLSDAAKAAYADVREGILALRTSLGPDVSFRQALSEYIKQWTEQSGVHATLEMDVEDRQLLPPTAELQLLRIVQEALTNVRKHAGAQRVSVRITADRSCVQVVIADDGRGFVVDGPQVRDARQPHFGLSTMRERAESVAGSLGVTSALNQGTRVVVRIPTLRESAPTAVAPRGGSER
jgi:nitrate/nitrite-specific signal transduction histidine kinase